MEIRTATSRKTPTSHSQTADELPEGDLAFLLRRAHQRSMSLLLSKLEAADLTPGQFFALDRLRGGKVISQNELGRQTAMDPATIQGVVQRLLARDLVARTSDLQDKRRLLLALSDKGRALLASLSQVTESTGRDLLRGFAPDQRRSLVEMLKRLAG